MLHPNASVERIQLWADALLSDEFTQGRNYLAYQLEDGSIQHCCLGVGCEVAIRHGLEIPRMVADTPNANGLRIIWFDGERHMLPRAVLDWYGLAPGEPAVNLPRPGTLFVGEEKTSTAARLNDELKVSYRGIAQILAAQFGLRESHSVTPHDQGDSDGE